MVFYHIRGLQFCFVNKSFGPKVVMVREMIRVRLLYIKLSCLL
jgi:hypothetical protein